MNQALGQLAKNSPLKCMRRNWYRRKIENGSAYSAVTAALALIFSIILIFDFFDSAHGLYDIEFKVLGVIICLATAVLALIMGKGLPKWVGVVGVGLHGLLTAYFMGYANDFTNAAANMQEMPVMAMFLAWFYPRNRARLFSAIYVSIVILAALNGPYGDLDTHDKLREFLRLTIFMSLCTELGAHWRQRIDSDAMIDELTGAINRRGMSYRGELEIERALRYNEPLSWALLDLDSFKTVNDTHGHSTGDSVLIDVVAHWKLGVRKHDYVCRLGGDEFVLILPHTTLAEAKTLLSRLHSTATHPWSWGVTEVIPGDTPASMTLRADRAMYENKSQQH